MPELPEAETIVRGLRSPVQGRTIVQVEVVHDDVLDDPPGTFARSLEGHRVEAVTRRGKNVVLVLDEGLRLVVNLGMSGRLLHRASGDDRPEPTHPAVVLAMDDESIVVYHDIRRFGRLHLRDGAEYRNWSRTLGPEPLASSFTSRRLAQGLARSISPIRSWLLDQRRIAGVGNIYASEALHRARIHPRTPACRINDAGTRRLHRAIRKVLRDAVEWKGTTFRDFRTADGREGSYAQRLRVYGREGEPCPRCGRSIRRIVFSNRSAFLCPRCQPEPSETS